jgi:N-acetylglutamate synthase-like GNAT family acetyltransferase
VVIRHQVFVVEESDPVIGVVVLVCNEEKMLLDNIAVQPNCQG